MVNKSSRVYHFAFILCFALVVLRAFAFIVSEVVDILILYAIQFSSQFCVQWSHLWYLELIIVRVFMKQWMISLYLFSGKRIIFVCRPHLYLFPISFHSPAFTVLLRCLILLQPTNFLKVEHGKNEFKRMWKNLLH